MKTILVPTDFSANAKHSVRYAVELSKKLNAKIVLFHAYTIPVYSTDVPLLVPTDYELKKEAIISLNKLREDLIKEFPGVDFHCKVQAGFAEDGIIEEEKSSKADFIVMGTRGASGLREFLIGSNTAGVIEKSVCPVIAVPVNAEWKGLRKIVFAANYGTDDFKNVYDVIDLARLFNSEVILLHVSTGKLNKTFEFNELHGFKQQIEEESKYPKISFKLMEDEDVFEGLNSYLEEINADMIAISMREPRFKKLFSRSMTKRMAYHTHIPLLAFHTQL